MRLKTEPALSVIIVVYNMRREAARTIYSALPPFQKDISPENYEILIVENGSPEPLSREYLKTLPDYVRYLEVPEPTPSPGDAINWAVEYEAQGENLLLCIDGARILSDGLISQGISLLSRFTNPFVFTLGWHLGPDVHMRAAENNYDQSVEDRLLKEIDWRNNADALFANSVLAGSSQNGINGPISESNAFFVSRKLWQEIGGYDQRFKSPGGGLCNLELFERYVLREDGVNILLNSEGTFHQFHGGAATSLPNPSLVFRPEYSRITGSDYSVPNYSCYIFGWPRESALPMQFGIGHSSL